eukprot:NODE_17034_length_964_cov_8.992832.p1 GENE.NODE_17034_length_964_cov_8.992832~~NODE_17034_length_964_cov_8.992832.p1  ORF type:complete len:225 (-),score=64.35 NODE_17034_length_964_cov_8.992832:163-837(-)
MADGHVLGTAVKRGALKFRGENSKAKKHRRLDKEAEPKAGTPSSSRFSAPGDGDEAEAAQTPRVPISEGTGRISSSTTTIHGFETKFKDEMEVGDTILLQHAVSLQVETRVVVSVLSQRSCVVHQGFSKDLVSTTEFHIRKDSAKLKEKAKASATGESDEAALASQELQKELDRKLRKQRKLCSVREKTGMWGYKTVTTALSREASQEELLDQRCKQGRDKYCF